MFGFMFGFYDFCQTSRWLVFAFCAEQQQEIEILVPQASKSPLKQEENLGYI